MSFADIFGDDGEEQQENAYTHADREWNKLQNEFTNAGFREGAAAGKEAALQDGFDHGFEHAGAPAGRALGLLRGQAAAALAIALKDPALQPLEFELRDVISKLSEVRVHELVNDKPAATTSPAHPHSDLITVERSHERAVDELETALSRLGSTKSKESLSELKSRLESLLQRIGLRPDV